MEIRMNLYTKRERNVLQSGQSKEVLSSGEISIDPLKVKVSEHFPHDQWDIWYFRCSVVLNAMRALSDYQTAPYLNDWRWYVPRTPNYLFLHDDDTRTHIRTVATPARLDQHLQSIVDRPHSELQKIVTILQEVDLSSHGILEVEMKIADRPRHYWEFSWTCARFENRNVIYIKR
ncbi:TPA: hypothetical protein ACTPQ1_004512 [Salmonella enterica]